MGYHVPAQPVSLVGRLHDWLEPRAQAKGPQEGSWRSAVWLGNGQLAVYGHNGSTYSTADGLQMRYRPGGLVVIDTGGWTATVVDPRSSSLIVATGALLSWGYAWDSGTQRQTGAGLGVYDATDRSASESSEDVLSGTCRWSARGRSSAPRTSTRATLS